MLASLFHRLNEQYLQSEGQQSTSSVDLNQEEDQENKNGKVSEVAEESDSSHNTEGEETAYQSHCFQSIVQTHKERKFRRGWARYKIENSLSRFITRNLRKLKCATPKDLK